MASAMSRLRFIRWRLSRGREAAPVSVSVSDLGGSSLALFGHWTSSSPSPSRFGSLGAAAAAVAFGADGLDRR